MGPLHRAFRTALVLALGVVAGVSVPSCGSDARAAASVEIVRPEDPDLPVLSFDAALDGAARRIVSLVPSCTEALFALGLGDRVVGVDRWADYPPEVNELPRLGDYTAIQTERILDLAPDLVVLFRGQEDAAQALDHAGIDVLIARTEGSGEVLPGLVDLAAAAGVEDRGARLAAAIEADMRNLAFESEAHEKPRVLIVFERHPSISVATRQSFVHRLLETAGGTNVSADADPDKSFVYVGLERVQDWEPDVILDFTVTNGTAEGVEDARSFWRLAGHDGVVVRLVDCPPLSRPGPRMGACARILSELIR